MWEGEEECGVGGRGGEECVVWEVGRVVLKGRGDVCYTHISILLHAHSL